MKLVRLISIPVRLLIQCSKITESVFHNLYLYSKTYKICLMTKSENDKKQLLFYISKNVLILNIDGSIYIAVYYCNTVSI